jgi:putative PEP-CTERM system histidine kinase
MFSPSDSFSLLGHGLSAAAYVVLAIKLSLREKSGARKADHAILAASILTAIWAAAGCAFALGWKVALFFVLLLDCLRYGAWFYFLILLIRGGASASDTRLIQGFSAAAAATLAAGIATHGAFAGALISVQLWHAMAWIVELLLAVMALSLLEHVVRNADPDSAWHIKPLAVGLAAAFLFDLYLAAESFLFRAQDPDTLSARGIVQATIVPLLWLASTRSRDWLAKIRLSQRAAFHSATLVLTGSYLIVMAGIGYYVREFGGNWGAGLAIVSIFLLLLGLAVVIVSASVRARLRVFVGKHFFSYRYDYREEWLRFTHTLSAQESSVQTGERIIRGLAALVESPSGALWVRDGTHALFTQFSRWNAPASDRAEPAESPLCRFMLDSGWVINLEEFRSQPSRYSGLVLPEWLSNVPNAWLITPLINGNELIGFVILGSSRTPMDVDWEINDLLRTAGRQAASYLAQMQSTEALLDARKFDAFNRMSAFVVHDLKNIVTQLSLMLRNAERHRDNPEFQKDMMETIQHSVERMRQLMLQLREGATPPGSPIGVDLGRIVERVAEAKALADRPVETHVAERLMTRGHEERMERVIGHLVQNAIDACGSSGRVWVRLERESGLARIEVGDTGHGMSPEFIRERLFKPFQTTKAAGMGIGAYESFQYIRELGGKVDVESAVGAGTRVTLLLPLLEIASKSDLLQGEPA